MTQKAEHSPPTYPYNRRPIWQWVLFYLIVAAIIYSAFYYLLFAKRGNTYTMQPNNPTPHVTAPATTITLAPSPSGSQSATPTTTAQEITVEGKEFAFIPAAIKVQKGQTVMLTFKNTGNYPHNLTISALNVQTKTISPGQQDTVTFTPMQRGTFSYICTVPGHEAQGMKGTITIE